MPNLTFIRFYSLRTISGNKLKDISLNEYENDVTLDKVTTIECPERSLEDIEQWLIYILPNLTHLIICRSSVLPSTDSELAPILNERIQRLDLIWSSALHQLVEISYVSNVRYIKVSLHDGWKKPEECAVIIMKILKNFKNLRTLIFHSSERGADYVDSVRTELIKRMVDYPNIENYQIKYYKHCCVFLKRNISK
jgi:hypothetical protein